MNSGKAWIKRHAPQRLWGALRGCIESLRRARYPKRTVVRRYGGKSLRLHIADPTGAEWYDHDSPPLPEVEILKQAGLVPGARVFNLGAHQCVVAMLLADAVGPQGSVLAVEASAADAAVGRRNLADNGCTNVHVLQAAVAETTGRLAFTATGRVNRGKGEIDGKVWVEGVTIDDLAERFGASDVLFMDIEGYEARGLQGAERTLRRNPDCLIEVHNADELARYGGSLDSVLACFPPDRYRRFAGSADNPEFKRWQAADDARTERFFLLALARR